LLSRGSTTVTTQQFKSGTDPRTQRLARSAQRRSNGVFERDVTSDDTDAQGRGNDQCRKEQANGTLAVLGEVLQGVHGKSPSVISRTVAASFVAADGLEMQRPGKRLRLRTGFLTGEYPSPTGKSSVSRASGSGKRTATLPPRADVMRERAAQAAGRTRSTLCRTRSPSGTEKLV